MTTTRFQRLPGSGQTRISDVGFRADSLWCLLDRLVMKGKLQSLSKSRERVAHAGPCSDDPVAAAREYLCGTNPSGPRQRQAANARRRKARRCPVSLDDSDTRPASGNASALGLGSWRNQNLGKHSQPQNWKTVDAWRGVLPSPTHGMQVKFQVPQCRRGGPLTLFKPGRTTWTKSH